MFHNLSKEIFNYTYLKIHDRAALPVYRSWIWGWWCRRVKCTKLLQNRVVSTRKHDMYLV